MAENKRFSENTSLAKKIAAGVMVLAVLLCGTTKLNNKRNDAIDVFKVGTSTEYTASVYDDLQRAARAAGILAGIAGDAELKELSEQLGNPKLMEKKDFSKMFSLFKQLQSRAQDAYTAYQLTSPNEMTLKDAKSQLTAITSAYSKASGDEFWQEANEFNKARKGFPAAFLGWLGGADKLPGSM